MKTKYEMVIAFSSDLEDQDIEAQIEKVTSLLAAHGGSLEKRELTGRQQTAYPMKKRTYAWYVVLIGEAGGSFVSDFNRQMRINDQVLRFTIVRKEENSPDVIRKVEERPPVVGRPDFRVRGEDAEVSAEAVGDLSAVEAGLDGDLAADL